MVGPLKRTVPYFLWYYEKVIGGLGMGSILAVLHQKRRGLEELGGKRWMKSYPHIHFFKIITSSIFELQQKKSWLYEYLYIHIF